jgi:hypothetical protein
VAAKRTIEVFTAGCSICEDTLRVIKDAVASCGCEVIERPCPPKQMCEEGKAYGVRAMPTVFKETFSLMKTLAVSDPLPLFAGNERWQEWVLI